MARLHEVELFVADIASALHLYQRGHSVAARGRDDTRDLQPMPVRPRTELTVVADRRYDWDISERCLATVPCEGGHHAESLEQPDQVNLRPVLR